MVSMDSLLVPSRSSMSWTMVFCAMCFFRAFLGVRADLWRNVRQPRPYVMDSVPQYMTYRWYGVIRGAKRRSEGDLFLNVGNFAWLAARTANFSSVGSRVVRRPYQWVAPWRRLACGSSGMPNPLVSATRTYVRICPQRCPHLWMAGRRCVGPGGPARGRET